MAAKYMPGTKFEMVHFKGPDDMHRVAMLALGIGLSWHTEGESDSPEYKESFDVIDTQYPENNRAGLSRRECEEHIWNLYCDELYK